MPPDLLTPPMIVRDAVLAGAVLAGLALWFGAGEAVGLGALVGLVNLRAWVWATTPGGSVGIGTRVLAKQLVAPCLLIPLLATYPPMAVFLGFCSVIVALAARALVAALSGQVRTA